MRVCHICLLTRLYAIPKLNAQPMLQQLCVHRRTSCKQTPSCGQRSPLCKHMLAQRTLSKSWESCARRRTHFSRLWQSAARVKLPLQHAYQHPRQCLQLQTYCGVISWMSLQRLQSCSMALAQLTNIYIFHQSHCSFSCEQHVLLTCMSTTGSNGPTPYGMPDFYLFGTWQESRADPKLLSCACVNLPHNLTLQYRSLTI